MIKFNPEKLFFTSDLHLSHKNYCKGVSNWPDTARCRDFNTLEEMNYTIIKSINDTVPEDGVLINCGDILFGDKTKLPNFLAQINCKTHYYLRGNHCEWFDRYPGRELFTWFGDYLEFEVDKKLVCCFHYACRVWNQSHKGSYQILGHSHGSLPLVGRQLDVGWDVWKKPISFKEVDQILSKVPINKVDHHV